MSDDSSTVNIVPQRGQDANAALLNSIEARYFLRKHSWRGKYFRTLCLTASGVVTLHPDTMAVTNSWTYGDLVSVVPAPKSEEEFQLTVRKGSKMDKTTFSTPFRAQLLSDLAQKRAKAAATPASGKPATGTVGDVTVQTFEGKKVKRTGEGRDVVLAVRPWGLCQVNPISGLTMATYLYHQMDRLVFINDMPGGFVLRYGTDDKRMYVFVCSRRDALVAAMKRVALEHIGVGVTVKEDAADFTRARVAAALRRVEEESVFNTLAEFQALKHAPARHVDPAARLVTFSDKYMVERNPGSYAVVTMRPLRSIDHVVRPSDDPQAFSVHYRDGTSAEYSSTQREALLTCLIDCVRACGSADTLLVSEPVRRGLKVTPVGVPVDATAEAQIVRALAAYNAAEHADEKDGGAAYFALLVETFNANIPYSGPHNSDTNKLQKQLVQALLNIVTNVRQPTAATFQALRRLAAVRSVFEAFTDNAPVREKLLLFLQQGLQSLDDIVVYATLEVMSAFMVPLFRADTNTTDDTNKTHMIDCARIVDQLFALFFSHVKRGTSPLVVLGCVDILTTMICPPYGDTTVDAQFKMLLGRVADLGRDFFKLFHQNNCLSVVRGAGLIMKCIIEEGGDIPDLVAKMQRCALVEGATLRHLHAALYTKNTTKRQVMFRILSEQLIAHWVSGCPDAEKMLSRVLPPAMVFYLESDEVAPAEAVESDQPSTGSVIGGSSGNSSGSSDADESKGTNVPGVRVFKSVLDQWRKPKFPPRAHAEMRRKKVTWSGLEKNWAMLFYQFRQDHLRADLVWNNHTREELREALENELRVFRQEQELAADGFISWNHAEFIVNYECLHRELNVNGYYLRLLLNPQPGQKAPVLRNPPEFFDMLFHRCLLEKDAELQALCIQALTIVYKFYHKAIGPFRDVAHLVALMRQCTDRLTRDRLLQLFYVLLALEENAKLFVDHGGVQMLVDLLTLVHFGVDHIIAPIKSNLITAGPARAEGEWFYTIVTPAGEKNADGTEAQPKKERFGPKNLVEMTELFHTGVLTPSTLCWAQGMEDWKPLGDIMQLRWSLMATGSGVMSSIDLASLLLDMLTKLCRLYPIRDQDGGIIRPLPRPKRQLSGPLLLPHVAQMLLTFNPVLVDKAALLLDVLLEDNMAAIPKAYLTGLFYFCFLYAGSNVLNIVKLVKRIHMQQHFREDDGSGGNDIAARSILGPLLPPAMIHLLERHTAEEFAAVYLGNNDTPEAIWNSAMRGMLIDKLSAHLGNFPQRLAQNPKAIYQYVPLPPVAYPEIKNELFCCHYYLRNFCDTARFPMWPVDNEVEFLQALLLLWSKQADKPEPVMSLEDARSTLKLKPGFKEDELRRAYFRLAKEYHPDKNPEGKAIFQKITDAYNLLSSASQDGGGGDADKGRVELLVRAQSILYVRFKKELAPFKYAGYPLLCAAIKTALDKDDRAMLAAGAELCYRTLQSTSLNAEELRRQDGLDILCDVLMHAVAQTFGDSKPSEAAPQTVANVLLTYATAASFEQSRAKIASLPQVPRCVCTCLPLANLPKVVEAALECVCCFALDEGLAQDLVALSVLYLVLPLLFQYDYTLDEAKVKAATDTTEPDAADQAAHNLHAQLALLAFSRLGGMDPACTAPPERANCVRALLTPGIADTLCKKPAAHILKDLNGDVETPLLIWNGRCRGEVLTFAEEKLRVAAQRDADFDADACRAFVYKTLARELQIGGVYVRVYNEQTAAHGTLPDPQGFCRKLVAYAAKSVRQYLALGLAPARIAELRAKYDLRVRDAHDDDPKGEKAYLRSIEGGLAKIRMAIEALRNLVRATRGIDALLTAKDDVQTIFSMLSITTDAATQRYALETIGVLTKNADCLAAIAAAQALAYLGPAIASPSPVCEEAVATLSSMLGNARIVGDCLAYGTFLFLLRVYASETERGAEITPRAKAAEALAKMSADPVHGSRVQIALLRFLPAAFLVSMRQDVAAAVYQFDGLHENPELIWTVATREQLRATLDTMCAALLKNQAKDPAYRVNIPEDYRVQYDELKGELELGGVYVRLFLKQPAWALRNPKQFLEALLTRYVEAYSQAARGDATAPEMMDTILAACNALLSGTPALCDYAAKTGHLAKIVTLMDNAALPRPPTAIGLVNILASSQLCVETLAATPCAVRAVLAALDAADDAKTVLRAVDTLDKAFAKNTCAAGGDACLVAQLLACDGTPRMLRVLEGAYDMRLGTDASEAKARTVAALQHATADATHGPRLRDVLDANPVWANYRSQRHDLFLPGQQVAGLLTAGGPAGATGGSIGLLTNSPHTAQAMSDAPPEL